jgi:uncharacterized protein YlxW (UPF0749 family)
MPSEAELKAALDEKDTELATLQASFDEYIESSKELESELESELAKVEEQVGGMSGLRGRGAACIANQST